MGNTCNADSHQFKHQQQPLFVLPNLQQLNKYLLNSNSNPNQLVHQDPKITTNPQAYSKFQDLISYLALTDSQFQDFNFRIKTQSARLNNLDRRYLKPVLLDNPHPTNIIQNNDQYTYLSAVFCYIADMRQYFKTIFCNIVNQYSVYIVRLYPNGKEMFIVVDNYVPIYKENISYSSSKKAEIWMCILEKAWVKLIGSYDKARALSPEDALEQILGIPSYSYELQRTDKQLENAIRTNKQKKCCILFIAKSNPNELKGNLFSRQVFYLEGFNMIDKREFYRLICSYDNFNWNKSELSNLQSQVARKYQQHQKQNKNVVYMSQEEIYNNFQFCTFGYFRAGYSTRSQQLQFFKEQQGVKYLKMRVDREEELNIRICQFYQGYVKQNVNYSYSSVYLRLWNLKNRLLVSQGCRRSPYSVKSSNVLSECFQRLEPGQYLLSIDIPWKFSSKVNKINLVTYSKIPIKFQQLSIPEGYNIEQQLIINSIPYQQINRQMMFEYAIHWKRNSVCLFISNKKEGNLQLKIHLRNSVNLAPLVYPFENKSVTVQLEREGKVIVEFRKINVETTGELGSFTFQTL